MILIPADDEEGDPVTLVLYDTRDGKTVLQLFRGKRVAPFYDPEGHLAGIVLDEEKHAELRRWL